MQRFLHSFLVGVCFFILFSCKKDDNELNVQEIKSNSNTAVANTSATQPQIQPDGYITATIGNSSITYSQHTLDCKGQTTNVDNSLICFPDGSKQLELIRNASSNSTSDRFEITASDNIDAVNVPYTLKAGSFVWNHNIGNTGLIAYRGLIESKDVQITITDKAGDHLHGYFQGTLYPDNASDGAPAVVKSGSFDIKFVRIKEGS